MPSPLNLLLLAFGLHLQTPADAIVIQLDDQEQTAVAQDADYWDVRKELVRKLYWTDAGHERLPKLFLETWQHVDPKSISHQIDAILEHAPSAALEEVARYTRAKAMLSQLPASHTDVQVSDIWGQMSEHCLFSKYSPEIAFQCAKLMSNRANRVRQYRIISQLYPGFESIRGVASELKDWSGRPDFELDFKNYCTNKPDSICSKRGKVILVYFSTADETPQKVPQMFDRYGKRGLDVIGIVGTAGPKPWSVLKDATHAVSRSWGVDKFPTLFLIDKGGHLAYGEPDNLEGRIQELLAEAQ